MLFPSTAEVHILIPTALRRGTHLSLQPASHHPCLHLPFLSAHQVRRYIDWDGSMGDFGVLMYKAMKSVHHVGQSQGRIPLSYRRLVQGHMIHAQSCIFTLIYRMSDLMMPVDVIDASSIGRWMRIRQQYWNHKRSLLLLPWSKCPVESLPCHQVWLLKLLHILINHLHIPI